MPGIQEKDIFFYEDFSSKDVNESSVGRKGLSLFKLKDVDVPVPSFFVVSAGVFTSLVYSALGSKLDNYLKEKKLPDPLQIRDAIFQTEISPEIQEEILKAYARLSGFSDAWVSVRSSVVYLPDGNILFPGVFATEVNVRGYDDLVDAIKTVYTSVFSDSVVAYARQHNVDLSQVRMGIVVQRMVQAEVSGVTYTRDPITQDNTKMSIEAVYGLGDVISKGEITPDRYVFNKNDLSCVEKNISPQDWMNIRSLKSGGTTRVEKIGISNTWSHKQKLEDRFLQDIAKISLIIEDSFGKEQNIEWLWESGKVWVLQHKAITVSSQEAPRDVQTNSSGILDPALGAVKQAEEKKSQEELTQYAQEKAVKEIMKEEPKLKEKFANLMKDQKQADDSSSQEVETPEDADLETLIQQEEKKQDDVTEFASTDDKLSKLSQKFAQLSQKEIDKEEKKEQKQSEKVAKEREKVIDDVAKNLLSDNLDMNNFNFLLTGIGVSQGTKVGKILRVNSQNYQDLVISSENIIIIEEVFDGIRDIIHKSGGILMDTGGVTSDVAVLAREFDLPAVVGTYNASKLLNEGDFVKIDAGSGGVYVYGRKPREELEGEKQKEKEVCEVSDEEIKVDYSNDYEASEQVDEAPGSFQIEYEVVDKVEKSAKSKKKTEKKEEKKEQSQKYDASQVESQKVEIPRTATEVYISDNELDQVENYVVKNSSGLVFCDLEKLMLEKAKHPLAFVEEGISTEYISDLAKQIDGIADRFSSTEVVVSIGNYFSNDFAQLTKGKDYEANTQLRGMYRYLVNDDLMKLALKIITRVRNLHRSKNVTLAVHSPLSGENMKSIKKQVLSMGLRRGSSFKIYAIIDNPSEVLLVQDILLANIDGIILNSPVLAKQMQGILLDDPNAVYSLDTNSLFQALESIKKALVGYDTEVIGITEDNENLIKKYIELGFSGVVVNGKNFLDMKKVIAEKEAELILSKGKI